MVLLGAVLLLTLPTIVAYYPVVGDYGAQYPWEYSAGNFIAGHTATGYVYIGGGILSLNYAMNARIVPGLSNAPQTSQGAQTIIESQLQVYEHSKGGDFISISSIFYATYGHLYGDASADTIKTLLSSVDTTCLTYSNGFTRVSTNSC